MTVTPRSLLAEPPIEPELGAGAEPGRAHATGSSSGAGSSGTARRSSRSSILVILIIACFGAPWLAPLQAGRAEPARAATRPEREALVRHRRARPRPAHARCMYAGQISLTIGFAVALLSTVVGVTSARSPAYFGKCDRPGASARVTDLFLDPARPRAARGRDPDLRPRATTSIILVLALLELDVHRARRARAGAVAQGEGVRRSGARVGRVEPTRIIMRHILPELRRPDHGEPHARDRGRDRRPRRRCRSSASACNRRRTRGAGCSPTARRTSTSTSKFYLVLFPGLMLLLTVLAVNFLGDGLRDAFDPQSQH